MMAEPTCFTRKCKHYTGVRGEEPNETYICKAFPDGIPDDISVGTNKHLTPVKGQGNMIVYEKAKP